MEKNHARKNAIRRVVFDALYKLNAPPSVFPPLCASPRVSRPSFRRFFSSLLASPRSRLRRIRVTAVVRERPSGTFYAEIRSDDMRLGLDVFDTADKVVLTYDAAAWRLNRPRRDVNFPEVMTREWAQGLAPPPRVVTEEDRRRNRRRECRLGIAEMDKHAMATWRQLFPQDVLVERAFFVQRRANRRTERAAYREDMRM
ncbi:Ethylene-responsive transcription factor CRF1 [Hordeum vulgare]|nr:Ethylene-responsive transcription factor CRF1 [Hordeum vulgare]